MLMRQAGVGRFLMVVLLGSAGQVGAQPAYSDSADFGLDVQGTSWGLSFLDSLDFLMDTRDVNPGMASSDSAGFAGDTRGVRRVWADSGVVSIENPPQQWVYNSDFLTDAQMEQYGSMSVEQVRAFLTTHNSYFRQPVADVDGQVFDMAVVIVDAATQHQINPQVLLATLQKESVAVTTSTRPSTTRMGLLMGAGASSTAREQVNEAARLFRAYLTELNTDGVTRSGWRVGVGKGTLDSVVVTPATKAVAALFTYTPYAGAQWGGNQPQWGGTYLFHHYWNAFGFGSATPSLASPTGLAASAVSNTAISLSWDFLAGAEGLRLERREGTSGPWTTVATLDSATTTYQNTGLSEAVTYYYRLAAAWLAGLSGYSRTVTASPTEALTPRITSVTPLTPAASGAEERMTIRGVNFGSSAVVTLRNIDTGTVYPDTVVLSASDTEIAITHNLGTSPGRWSARVSNGTGSWSPEVYFATTIAGALFTNGFSYPIGADGRAYGWDLAALARNDLYQVPLLSKYVDMPPERGGSGTDFSLDEWYNAQDVGSFLGLYNDTLYGGIHSGEDWNRQDDADQPVYAVAYGQVVRITSGSSGDSVILRHYLPWLQRVYSIYVHVDPGVNVGQWVTKGQQIATIADTAVPHLHFEMRDKWTVEAVFATLNVRDTPAGNDIGAVSAGNEGIIIDGPVEADLSGTVYTWWKVQWNNGMLGWSADVGLDLRVFRTANSQAYYTDVKGTHGQPAPTRTTMSREQVETTYGLMREQGILDASDFLSDHKWVSLGQRLLNGAFEAMSLAGWVTGGGGTVSLVSAGTSSAGSWAKLTTGSPVTISQAVTTPQDPFELTFSYELTTASGTLDVLLDSVVLATIAVPDPPPVGPETFTKLIADPQLLGREDAVLTFRFNGPAGSEVLVSNIEMESSVPPSPPLVPADFDRDGDVDLTDFSHLQACLNGSESPQTDPNCQDAKLNADDKVDRADVDIFLGCLSGSGVPADPNCAGQ